jgi:hypothetical protein
MRFLFFLNVLLTCATAFSQSDLEIVIQATQPPYSIEIVMPAMNAVPEKEYSFILNSIEQQALDGALREFTSNVFASWERRSESQRERLVSLLKNKFMIEYALQNISNSAGTGLSLSRRQIFQETIDGLTVFTSFPFWNRPESTQKEQLEHKRLVTVALIQNIDVTYSKIESVLSFCKVAISSLH